jgi:hypothetical protein
MPKDQHDRAAYGTAKRFEHHVLRILDRITATHPQAANELAEYTNQMLKCLRRSNSCIGTKKGQHHSIQAGVWMVEALIVLHDLKDNNVERVVVTAAAELLERVEDALREEGSLPPERD